MVFGDHESSAGRNAIPQISSLVVGGEADLGPGGSNVTSRLLEDGWQNQNHLRRDVHPDTDLERSVIARRMSYVTENYPERSDELARVALGVALVCLTMEINSQDLVHFLHLAQGDMYLRSHACQTYLYENGAFRLFNGVMPGHVLQRCKDYASYVEGCLWCIDKIFPHMDEVDIFAAMGRLFRAITSHCRSGATADPAHGGITDGYLPRGAKIKRPWLSMDGPEITTSRYPLEEKEIFPALMYLSLDRWEAKRKFGGPSNKTWGAQEAVNCQALWRKLASKIETADIIPFYAEYMEVDKVSAAGFTLEDACLMYDPSTAHDRGGRNLKQVDKRATNNIYTYIARTLTDEIEIDSHRRLVGFLNTTFYDNEYAFRCTIAGISMALLGENVDRAFWTIGSGGVGQSLLTTLIRNAISPMRGFFDCTSLYLDGELRKTMGHIVGYFVLTAQEGTEGVARTSEISGRTSIRKFALRAQYPVDSRTLKVARWYRPGGCCGSS